MRRRAVPVLAGILAALLVALSACSGTDEPTVEATLTGMTHAPYPVADIDLTTTGGDSVSLATDLDKPLTLVFFGYTNCPDICPLVMSTLAAAMVRLDQAERDQVQVLFITSDPTRDTPPVLEGYLGHYDPSFVGLTGTIDDIASVAESMHIYVSSGEELPSGGYDFNAHGTQISGLDDNGRATVLWSQDISAATLATDIRIMLQESK